MDAPEAPATSSGAKPRRIVFSVTVRSRRNSLQVVGAAGLGADPRELEAAERLAVDEGAGDRPVDVEVADAELALDPLDVRGAPRVEAAGQGVVRCRWRSRGPRRGRGRGGRPGPGRRSPPGRSARRGATPATIVRADEVAPVRQRADVGRERRPGPRPRRSGRTRSIRSPRLGVDHRADDGVGVLGRADGQGAGRLDQAGEERVVDRRRGRSRASRPSTSGPRSRRRSGGRRRPPRRGRRRRRR